MITKIFKLFSIVLAAAMLLGMTACGTAAPRVLKLWYYEPPDGALGKA